MDLSRFEMIDSVIKISLSELIIKTESQVPVASSLFEAHFPGFAVLPGVLLTEIMGQSSCLITMAADNYSGLGILAAQNNTSYRHFVRPGDRLSTEVILKHLGDGFSICQAKVKQQEGIVVTESDLTIKLIPFFDAHIKAAFIRRYQRLLSPVTAKTERGEKA
ncbi:hypothetical protein KKJ06_12815 [Xenorhabdus bovienii]|uniref:3-hydroxyacyl-ACP dehydratase FabZ family protein n=1 Tax=Xenorhabdus bovienii TaxID=40576 RepID=UPI0023B313BF|nr:hypothetical protein [Xenorhabdus bovienii]MDE9482412.1 hypothetical protein [Xenorhabdus bovienii]MDE9556288.1 hypothetical protein [Xenorhabdus bovienii]